MIGVLGSIKIGPSTAKVKLNQRNMPVQVKSHHPYQMIIPAFTRQYLLFQTLDFSAFR